MMRFLRCCAVVAGFLMMAGQAMAAASDFTPVQGNWVDKLPDGTGMVVSITDTAVSFTTLDARGLSSGPPTKLPVTITKMADGTFYFIPAPETGEPFEVRVVNADSVVIRFPDLQPRTLSREKPAAPKPRPH